MAEKDTSAERPNTQVPSYVVYSSTSTSSTKRQCISLATPPCNHNSFHVNNTIATW